MSDTSKRELAAATDGPSAKRLKAAKLGDDRVAAMPVGNNLIEVDGKSCTHEVCWPPGVQGSNDPPKARPGAPAREYPFKVDPFQQTAINALEAGGCSCAAVQHQKPWYLQMGQLRHPAAHIGLYSVHAAAA